MSGRGDDDKGPSWMECSSPRRIIARLFRRMTVKKQMSARVTTTPSRRARETMIHTIVPGNNKKENVINLGVACSLFYLTMASKTELEKMKELQRDTQVLLGEIKELLPRKNRAPEPSEVVESPTSCLSDAGAMFNCLRLRAPFVLTEEGTVRGDWSGDCGKSKPEGVQEIEKLEVEMEAELERLQLHLDSESPSKQGHQRVPKTRNADSARNIMTVGEVMNLDDARHSDLQGGVAPVELERKLHELLESRQEEQIKELEAAVVYYKRELCKKEREISWWRNTALLLSHHAKESPSKVM